MDIDMPYIRICGRLEANNKNLPQPLFLFILSILLITNHLMYMGIFKKCPWLQFGFHMPSSQDLPKMIKIVGGSLHKMMTKNPC
jgi:hypothetical protein